MFYLLDQPFLVGRVGWAFLCSISPSTTKFSPKKATFNRPISFTKEATFCQRDNFPKIRYKNVEYFNLVHVHKPIFGLLMITRSNFFLVSFLSFFLVLLLLLPFALHILSGCHKKLGVTVHVQYMYFITIFAPTGIFIIQGSRAPKYGTQWVKIWKPVTCINLKLQGFSKMRSSQRLLATYVLITV